MKIGILYIATGKYSCFWQEFYQSSEKYLFTNDEKHYFVFTDSPDIKGDNVTFFYRECQGFPADSLFRFEMFVSIKEQLESMDYLYFFNANTVFQEKISDEIIPHKEHSYLVTVIHPLESIKKRSLLMFPYEHNKKSLAYIKPYTKPKYHYYQGCFFGGRTAEVLALCEQLNSNIQNDYERGIVALVHDESHLNRYFRDNPPLALGDKYAVPEGWNLKMKGKILLRDKTKISASFNKRRPGIYSKITKNLRVLFYGIKRHLKI